MHIVQLEAVPPLIPHPRASRGEAWTEEEQNDNDILLLEHCWRGSLHKALCKVWKAGPGADLEVEPEDLSFPNRALWQMFHCRKLMRIFRAMDLLAAIVSNMVFPPHQLLSPALPWHTRRQTLTPFILGPSGNASRPGQIRRRSLDWSTSTLIPTMVIHHQHPLPSGDTTDEPSLNSPCW
jgi:hypothetical protein